MATGTYNTAEDRVNAANAQATSGAVGGAETASGIVSQNGYTPITPSSLAPSAPLKIPETQPTTAAAGLSGHTDQTVINGQSALDKQLADKVAADTAAKTESKSTLSSIMDKIVGVQNSRPTEEDNAHLTELSKLSNDTFTALQASKRAQQKEIQALDTQPGMTELAKSREINAINTRYASPQADLSIAYDVANRNYTSASQTVDRKIALQLEPLQTELGFQTKFFEDNKDALSKDEQNQLQNLIDKNKTAIADKKDVGEVVNDLFKNNPTAATPELLKDLTNNATDKLSADSILAKHGVSLQNPQDIAYKQAQIASLNATAAAKTATGASGGGVSQELQDAINNGTIDPNKINSRTLGIYNDIAKAGVDAVGAHAGAAGETKAITDLSSYKSTATRTLGVLESNLPLVEGLADKVNTIGTPLLDAYVTGKKALLTNDPNVIKYVNSLKTLRAEYAQMLAKGNVATEGDKLDAEQAIPAGLSSAGYAALGEQLKLEARNILAASDAAIKAAKSKSASNTGGTDLNSQFDNLFKQYGGQ